jgi:hypothetical protein
MLKNELLEILVELKEAHHALELKAEFEAEGATYEEALFLKELAACAGLGLAVKIGGSGALCDMRTAKTLGANTIVAPMVESPYALKKYIHTAGLVFNEGGADFWLNIETIVGFENLDAILKSPEAESVAGIVFGRSDMAGSMGLNQDNANSAEILNIANEISKKASEHGKKLIIGGGISPSSLPFLAQTSKLYGFETRKVVFSAHSNAEHGILKALEFELIWLENRSMSYPEDIQRAKKLRAYIENVCVKK